MQQVQHGRHTNTMAEIKSENLEKVAVQINENETIDAVKTTVVLEESQTYTQTKEQLEQQKASLQEKIKKIESALALLK